MTRRDRWILLITLLLTGGLPLADLLSTGVAGAIRYAAADAFYYDTVARNIATLGRISFDQIYPTNGFHPLWQFLLAGIYLLCHLIRLSDGAFIVISILCSISLITAAVYLVGRTFIAVRGRLSTWFLTLPVGAYALLFAPYWIFMFNRGYVENSIEGPPPFYGTLFSFMNGMESPLSLFLFAGVIYRYSTDKTKKPLLDGLLLAALTLSRLDLVFISGSILAWLCWQSLSTADRKSLILKLAGFAGPVFVYLIFNRLYAGSYFPSSGATKTSFPHLGMSCLMSMKALLEYPIGGVDAVFRAWRTGQIVVPAFFALAALPFLLLRTRRIEGGYALTLFEADRLDQLLAAAVPGVVVLATYDFWFVADYAQGHWYFAGSIFWMSVAALSLLTRVRCEWQWKSPILAALLVSSTVAIFFRLHRRIGGHAEQAALFARASEIRSHYQSPPKIVELEDGLIGFTTGFPSLNALGLAVDKEAATAIRQGTFADLAHRRGFDRLAVFSYNSLVFSQATPDQLKSWHQHPLRLPPGVSLELEYTIPGTRFGVFRLVGR